MPEPLRALSVAGRYELYEPIASGGMGTVYIGRMAGPRGFSRVVAIKRLHPHLAGQERFISMLLDEARLATRISHPHVVPILDVVEADGELLLVLEYVHGCSLSRLMTGARELGAPCPPRVAASLIAGICHGLHAAHLAKDESGRPMALVHRDVSPQNILVGGDGIARITDFGIAKATGRAQATESGQIKGKFSYMAPEQLQAGPLDCRVDVFGSGIVLWELLAGKPLFDQGSDPATIVTEILFGEIQPPSHCRPEIPPALDAVVMRALARDPADRFASSEEMATALTAVFGPVPSAEVALWINETGADEIAESSRRLASAESGAPPAAGAAPRADEEREPIAQSGPVTVTSAALSLPTRSRRRVGGVLAGVALLLGIGVVFVSTRAPEEPATAASAVPLPSASLSALPEEPSSASTAASAVESASPKRNSARPRRTSAPRLPSATPAVSSVAPPPAARVLEGIPNDRTWSQGSSGTQR